MKELETSLRALRLANNDFINKKDEAYLLTIMAQLRALVTMGGKDMTPLLLDLSDELLIPLELYSLPPKPLKAPQELVASLYGGKTWSTKDRPDFIKYTLKEWLTAPAYFVDETMDYRTRNQVIKHISNKEGGSHYDKKVAVIIDNLRRQFRGSQNGEINGLQLFLLDVSALVFWIGTKMGYVWNCMEKGIDEKTDERIVELDYQFEELVI